MAYSYQNGDIVWEDDGGGSAPEPAQSSAPAQDETANWGGESHGNQNTDSAPETNWWSGIFDAGSELGNSVHDALFGRSSAQEPGQRATGDGKTLSEQKSGDQPDQAAPAKSKGLFNDPQSLLKMGFDGLAGYYKNEATRDAAALMAQGRTNELSQIEAQKVAAQQRYNDSFAAPVARTGIIQTALKRINGQQVFTNGSLRK